MSRRITHLFLVMAGVVFSSCATAPRIMNYDPAGTDSARQVLWPAEPAEPKLEYVGQLLGETNFAATDGSADGAGTRLLRWIAGLGKNRTPVRQLVRPQTGVVDNSGRILVTDAGIPGVMVFDVRAAELTIWRDAAVNQPFVSPIGIADGQDGSVFIADSALGFVARLSTNGEPLGRIGADVLVRPTGVTRNPANGHIYVADTPQDDIKVFTADGELVTTLGRPGIAPGEFNGPTHLAFGNDKLYVTDALNARVQVLNADGIPLSAIGDRGLYVGNLVRPKGVTSDSDGNVYIVESYFDHLLIFDERGQLLLPIGGSGKAVGRFFLPAGAWSDAEGRIFIADMFNGRIVILRYLKG